LNRTLSLLVVIFSLLGPAAAGAATVSPAAIPDGTYTVKVEKIVDSKHVEVVMDNGSQTTLVAGRSTVDFSKIQPSDQIKVSLIQGTVMVYLDLTSH
jgi:translation initiation factor IF-1